MQQAKQPIVDRRSSLEALVRRGFRAYETNDRAEMERLLSADFTFTSPYDDHIDRAAYFERCWPGAGTLGGFDLQQVTASGDVCLVMYQGRRKHGNPFHNIERWQFTGDQVSAVEVFFGLPPNSKPELPPEVAVRQVLDQRIQATRNKDARALVALYARDAVAFGLAPPLREDAAALCDPAGIERWLAGWNGPVQIELRDLHIVAHGEVGFATALQRLVATAHDGERTDLWMRASFGFVLEDGAWKISHVHESVPFAMDGSFRALVDLKP